MYPLSMIVGSSGKYMVLPQDERVSGGHVAQLRAKTTVFGVRLWHIVLHLQQKFELQLKEHSRRYHRPLTADLYVNLVIQPIVLPFLNNIQEGVLQHDNAHPYTTTVIRRAQQRVDMLPWYARSPDMSPIEHVWDVIERQLQLHPQPALTVPVLA
ncbi:DDE_3 domain-containing protein [Trichonephila clavipes]|nr:DDE_3 domain-containing protein [Trichonephila clavipes]